jgi:predicted TIM-barrel enzyme
MTKEAFYSFCQSKRVFSTVYVKEHAHDALRDIEFLTEAGVSGIILDTRHGSVGELEMVLEQLSSRIAVGIHVAPDNYRQSVRIADAHSERLLTFAYLPFEQSEHEPFNQEHYYRMREQHPTVPVVMGLAEQGLPLQLQLKLTQLYAEGIVVRGKTAEDEVKAGKLDFARKTLPDMLFFSAAAFSPESCAEQLAYVNGIIVGPHWHNHADSRATIDRQRMHAYLAAAFAAGVEKPVLSAALIEQTMVQLRGKKQKRNWES